MHQTVLSKLKKYKIDSLKDHFIKLQRSEDIKDEECTATARMFRLVFVEAKANVAFSNHKLFVDLEKIHGVDLGNHWSSIHGSIEIMLSISSQFHQRLINHLMTENKFCFQSSKLTDTQGWALDCELSFYMIGRPWKSLEDNDLRNIIVLIMASDENQNFLDSILVSLLSIDITQSVSMRCLGLIPTKV